MLTPWLMSGLLGLLQYLLRTTASVSLSSFVVFVLYQLVRLVALLELAFQVLLCTSRFGPRAALADLCALRFISRDRSATHPQLPWMRRSHFNSCLLHLHVAVQQSVVSAQAVAGAKRASNDLLHRATSSATTRLPTGWPATATSLLQALARSLLGLSTAPTPLRHRVLDCLWRQATLEYTPGEGQAATSRRCLAADLVQALVTWAVSVLNRHTRSSERIRSAQRLTRLYPAVVNRSLIPATNATSFALLKNSHALNQTTVLVRRYTSLVDDLNDGILGRANRQAEATLPQAVERPQVPPHAVFPALDRLVQHLSRSSRLPLTEVLIAHLNLAAAELDLAEKDDELLEAVLDAVLAWDETRRHGARSSGREETLE